MSTEQNKASVRRAFEEGWNQGNVAVFDELATPNYIYHDPAAPHVRTLEDYKQWVNDTRIAFPDLHFTIEDLIAEGDKVVARCTLRGTNTGNIVRPMPLPATGKQITITGIAIVSTAGGRAVEVWSQSDGLGFMQQLGLIPSME